LLKRQLYLIPVETRRGSDAFVFVSAEAGRNSIVRSRLLSDVDSTRFFAGEPASLRRGFRLVIGARDRIARTRVPTRSAEGTKGRPAQCDRIRQAARRKNSVYYQQKCADFFRHRFQCATTCLPALMVSGDQLLIGGRTRIPRRRVEALLQHENRARTWSLATTDTTSRSSSLRSDWPEYDGFQEGLAVLAEYLVGGLSRSRLFACWAARVVGAHHMLNGRLLHRYVSARWTATTSFRSGPALYNRHAALPGRRLDEGTRCTCADYCKFCDICARAASWSPYLSGKFASAHFANDFGTYDAGDHQNPPALRPRYLETHGGAEEN